MVYCALSFYWEVHSMKNIWTQGSRVSKRKKRGKRERLSLSACCVVVGDGCLGVLMLAWHTDTHTHTQKLPVACVKHLNTASWQVGVGTGDKHSPALVASVLIYYDYRSLSTSYFLHLPTVMPSLHFITQLSLLSVFCLYLSMQVFKKQGNIFYAHVLSHHSKYYPHTPYIKKR